MEQVTQLVRIVDDAARRFGEANPLALQLEVFHASLVDPGQGWEAERLRLQMNVAQNPQIAAEYELMIQRVGPEAALQLDTSRKERSILEGQVQFLFQANQSLRANIRAATEEAQRIATAHRNEIRRIWQAIS